VKLPFIFINLPEGKTKETKEKFAKAIHEAVVNILGAKGEWIIFNELGSQTGNVARNGEIVE